MLYEEYTHQNMVKKGRCRASGIYNGLLILAIEGGADFEFREEVRVCVNRLRKYICHL
jgi:hypothetical protein